MDLNFTVAPKVKQLGIKVCTFLAEGLDNSGGHPEFDAWKASVTQEAVSNLNQETLKEDPVILGYRDLHTRLGKSNHKFTASPEALISYALKRGGLPSINLVVDIYNLVSIRTRLSLGCHDVSQLSDRVELRMTTGSESFLPMGETKTVTIPEGEYCYIDGESNVICRMECRQTDSTKVTLNTESCLFIVQGNGNTDWPMVESTTEELSGLVTKYCGGTQRRLS